MLKRRRAYGKNIMNIDEEEYDSDLTRSYEVGISAGLDVASNYLLEKARQYFGDGDDEMAKLLRGLSIELDKQSKDKHPGPSVSKDEKQ